MKRLIAGASTLALAGVGTIALAGPLSAQDEGTDEVLGEIEIQGPLGATVSPNVAAPGAEVTVTPTEACPEVDDPTLGWALVEAPIDLDPIFAGEVFFSVDGGDVPIAEDGTWSVSFVAPPEAGDYQFFAVCGFSLAVEEMPEEEAAPAPADEHEDGGDHAALGSGSGEQASGSSVGARPDTGWKHKKKGEGEKHNWYGKYHDKKNKKYKCGWKKKPPHHPTTTKPEETTTTVEETTTTESTTTTEVEETTTTTEVEETTTTTEEETTTTTEMEVPPLVIAYYLSDLTVTSVPPAPPTPGQPGFTG